MSVIDAVEDGIERLDQVIIAAESWAKLYLKDPKTHAELIKTEARLARKLRRHYRDLAAKASKMVNWSAYRAEIKAVAIDVIVDDAIIDDSKGSFIKVVFDQINTATWLGAAAGETIYKRPLGIQSTDSIIQDIALNHVAQLVTQVNDTIKQDIRSSIQTSIAMGETVTDASDRLQSIISEPGRADRIARTETVNSYGQGLKEFGNQSGAIGKEWQDTGATDECADNTDAGPIEIDALFPSDDDTPAAHPNCRCSMRLIYQNELDENPDLFG